MTYPTIAEVVAADREQLKAWWNDLDEPRSNYERRALELVFKKLLALGVSPSCPKGGRNGRL